MNITGTDTGKHVEHFARFSFYFLDQEKSS